MQGLYLYGKSEASTHGTHLLRRVNTFSFHGTGGYFYFCFFIPPPPYASSRLRKKITATRMQAFSRRKEYGNLSEFLSQTAQKCLHSEWGYAIINKLILKRPCGQAAKTAPSHGAIPGSIPGKVTTLNLNRTTPLRVCAV